MSRDFDWPEFLFLLGALRWTIVLSLIAFVGGGLGGLVLAIARTSSHAILRWLAATYIGVMQGTPVLMQLFLAYYGLAVLTGMRIDPWPAVTIAFTRYAALAVITLVFPEPAPARTRVASSSVITDRRCSGVSGLLSTDSKNSL